MGLLGSQGVPGGPRGSQGLGRGANRVSEKVPEHPEAEPSTMMPAEATAGVSQHGTLCFDPISLKPSVRPSFHCKMSLKCSLPPIIRRLLADGQLAEDRRLHQRHAAASVGDLSASCQRERAVVAS